MITGIGIGSNMGDKRRHLEDAIAFLRNISQDRELKSSGFFETSPLDCPPGSGLFLNAALEMEYEGDLSLLLEKLGQYEEARGRPSIHQRNAPRTIDLDILYVDDLQFNSARLEIPHPRLAERLFVLEPLAEIAPQRLIPGKGKTVVELLALCRMKAKDQICRKIE